MVVPNPRIGRRLVVKGVAGAGLLAAGGLLTGGSAAGAATRASGPLPEVPALDPSTISLSDFTGLEQDIAPYLGLLAALANSVEDDDEATFGFITCNCWRRGNARPGNARVQENVLTMAYFYSVDRPWNPYHGDEALRRRLEAALLYWVGLQNDDGSFPQGPVDAHSRPTTAFALDFIGYWTLEVLDRGPGIDPDVYEQVAAATRHAVQWFLTDEEVWGPQGDVLANQVAAGMTAIGALLPRLSDPALATLFRDRVADMAATQQGAAGFFRDGAVAHRYGVEVQSRDMALWADGSTQAVVDQMQERYVDWLQYNVLYDSDVSGFFVNTATDTRHTRWNHFEQTPIGANNLWTGRIDLAAAFSPTREDIAAAREQWWSSTWQEAVEPLMPAIFRFMSAAPIRHVLVAEEHYPSAAEQALARTSLRPIRAGAFTEYRADDVLDQQFMFAKRPPYVVGMSFGKHAVIPPGWGSGFKTLHWDRVRFGLNYVWHDRMGMVVQSHNALGLGDPAGRPAGDELAWGTARHGPDGFEIDAYQEPSATFYADDREIDPADLGPRQAFRVEYAPTQRDWVRKSVDVAHARLGVDAVADGEFWEQIPLVLAPTDQVGWLGSADGAEAVDLDADVISTEAAGVRVARNGSAVQIVLTGRHEVSLERTDTTMFNDKRRIYLLTIIAADNLEYVIVTR